MQPTEDAMLSRLMQPMEDAMLSQLMEPVDGGVLSEVASHIFNLICYCKPWVLEVTSSFSCSNASHSSSMSMYTPPEH